MKPQGRRGEVAADILTDFPERFAERKRVYALAPDGSRRELQVEEFWPHKGRMVLKFGGVDSISDAEMLAGYEVQIPIGERAPLEQGATYVSDLLGCTVLESGRELGVIADVQFGAGEAPLLVVKQGSRELLIPLAEEFLRELDVNAKRVVLALPEGMLELDAPLRKDEKAAQKNNQGR